MISLQGINCFRVIKEEDQKYNFRLVNAEIINNDENEDTFDDKQKFELLNKYKNYVETKSINLGLEEIEKIELSQIIKFIAMISPFKDEDKQVLLETQDLQDFYRKLLSIIDLELVGNFDNKTIN